MSTNLTVPDLNSSIKELNQYLEREELMQTTDIVIIAIVLVIIFIISLIGNASVFLVFYKKPALVTISNRFIVNLSVCNVLETIFVMPFVFFALVSQTWYFGNLLCQITGFLINTIFAASTLTLVVIAIDRYCAIVTPLHYSTTITKRRAGAMILLVWLLAVCCSVPPLIGWNRYEYQRKKSVCTAVANSRNINDRSFTVFLVVLCFIIPLVIILWSYCVIFKAARNSSEKVRRNSVLTNPAEEVYQTPFRNGRRNSAVPILAHRLSVCSRGYGSQIWQRDEWKAAVTSFLVVFTFIICWLLYFIIITIECISDDPDDITPVMKTISVLLAMSSCAFNPVVYVFRGKIQRTELKTMLGLQMKGNHLGNGFSLGANIASSRSPCISRQGSEESDIIPRLHHVTTTTTLTSVVVTEEPEYFDSEPP